MKNKLHYFFGIIIFLVLTQLFIYSTNIRSEDKLHQGQFNRQYGIFAIVQPKGLNFAGEEIPIHSSEIWERIDKELLVNTYWQSNTMLYFKKANKYFPIIEPILKKYNIPDDFKYLTVIESGLENVVSPSGAAGFWQIMKQTGREYGLEVNNSIDENELKNYLSKKDNIEPLANEELQARNMGINSVPTFIVNKQIVINGAQTSENFELIFQKLSNSIN